MGIGVQSFKKIRDTTHSFGHKYPELLKYWDFEKNELKPFDVFPNSTIKVWWTCPYGHSVKLQVRVRIRYQVCKECKKLLDVIEDSLYNLFPDIAKDWDYAKNYPITPFNIKPRSRRKRSWICPEKRHRYEASPDNRTGNSSRCPYCYGSKKSRRS